MSSVCCDVSLGAIGGRPFDIPGGMFIWPCGP